VSGIDGALISAEVLTLNKLAPGRLRDLADVEAIRRVNLEKNG
jgi:hypothetical protein